MAGCNKSSPFSSRSLSTSRATTTTRSRTPPTVRSASGLLHGLHGVGKSFLIHRWTQELSQKQFRVLLNTHSFLMGNDLLRNLLSLAGQKPCFRRGDNVQALWKDWPIWPLVIIEETQDLNAAAIDKRRQIQSTDVQSAIDTMPWVARETPLQG